ncbi:hypothetical protein RF55_2701 [Lasius niger]|uniref:Uncharacterized protein n=1 Tax=Lasius niger TaxID=67767 RepID=A0A0J7L3J3_LASNI|nr:hypothetical protein RF55_2701 [Lasius niger]
MPGIASATGLLSARIRPVRRPKPKATEGKALLLPEEMEMIRTSLLAVGAGGNRGEMLAGNVGGDGGDGYNAEMTASAVPEELFRKYTETDSRPLTPAPTLASGPTALTSHAIQEDLPVTCNPRERTTLVLDLRTNSQNQQVRRIALEEALRVKGDAYSTLRGSRQTSASLLTQNAPRVFSRQAVRFELLDSQSLRGLTSLRYLSKHVYITSGRKLIFGRIFNRFNEEALHSVRRISSTSVEEALQEVIGKALTDEQRSYLRSVIGEITDSLDFREWCGLCAAVERLLCPLPPKTSDPPAWLEKADFEALERRLKSAESVYTTLALLLKEIRDR